MSIRYWKCLGLRANADIDADLASGRALIHLFVPVRRAWLRNREGYRRRVNSIGTTKLSPDFTMVISDRYSGLKLASVWEQIFSLYGELIPKNLRALAQGIEIANFIKQKHIFLIRHFIPRVTSSLSNYVAHGERSRESKSYDMSKNSVYDIMSAFAKSLHQNDEYMHTLIDYGCLVGYASES